MPLLLLINGHPSQDSFCESNTKIVQRVAKEKNYEVKTLRAFEYPFLGHVMKEKSYGEAYEEPAELISQAEIIVLTFPMWNFSLPGGLKNFLDGALQSKKHFHFKKIPILNMGVPVGHLRTKKVISIYTGDGPKWFYRLPLLDMDIARKQIKECFRMVGIPFWRLRFLFFGDCSRTTDEVRKKWLEGLERKLKALL